MLDFYKRYKGPFITHYHLDGLVLAVIYNLNCKAFLRTASGDVIKMVHSLHDAIKICVCRSTKQIDFLSFIYKRGLAMVYHYFALSGIKTYKIT